uniref:Fe-ADH domain-containing protein n=1 Tax=Macrostomum lignano TaxID=282301 RepID=A0A1I8FPA2_9PLAT
RCSNVALLATLVPAHSACGHRHHARVLRRCHQTVQETEYAFEMAVSTVRYGPRSDPRNRQDVVNLGAKRVLVATVSHPNSVPFDVYPDVRVEPTDSSFKSGNQGCRRPLTYDRFHCRGGSVIDTAKQLPSLPDFLDYVNAPICRGLPPLIAVPTTSGTGSETTGASRFRPGIYAPQRLGSPIEPSDPLWPDRSRSHSQHAQPRVSAYSGFDMLSVTRWSLSLHCRLQSNQRCLVPLALDASARYFRRAVRNPSDSEARSAMHLAACMAGVGFGNAGVHLCQRPVLPHLRVGDVCKQRRLQVRRLFRDQHALIPHGLSVVITAPKVFEFTGAASPDRHLGCPTAGADVTWRETGGCWEGSLPTRCASLCTILTCPDGLQALGFDGFAHRLACRGSDLRSIAPCPQTRDDIAGIYQASMRAY